MNIVKYLQYVLQIGLMVWISLPIDALQLIQGSGKMITEKREVEHFTQLNIDIFGDIHIKHNNIATPGITITAEDNLMTWYHTEVRGQTLYIYPKNKDTVTFINQQPIELNLGVNNLEAIHVNGENNLFIDSILMTDALILHLNGRGKAKIQLDATKLMLKIAGNRELNLTGRVHDQAIEMNGSCRLLAKNLQSRNTKIKLVGEGKAEISVTSSLQIDLWGNGEVNYYGKPKVEEKIIGIGKVISLVF